jgi:hypothetical protein
MKGRMMIKVKRNEIANSIRKIGNTVKRRQSVGR